MLQVQLVYCHFWPMKHTGTAFAEGGVVAVTASRQNCGQRLFGQKRETFFIQHLLGRRHQLRHLVNLVAIALLVAVVRRPQLFIP